jgi:hypothetical protein
VVASALPLYEEGGSLRPTCDAKLLKDIREIVFHSFVTEPKGNGNFLVGLPLSNQCHDSFFLR